MANTDLDRAAELTIWPRTRPARTAQSRAFPSLRAALRAATEILSGDADLQAWIVTESGDILSPRWIETHASAALNGPDPAECAA